MRPKHVDHLIISGIAMIGVSILFFLPGLVGFGLVLGLLGALQLMIGVIGARAFDAEEEWAAKKQAKEQEERALQLELELKRRRDEAQRRHDEVERQHSEWRDADTQDTPYVYECVGHPNRTLALRYGIANFITSEEYCGERGQIKLRKIQKVYSDDEGSHYLAELTDFGDRRIRVVIQPGTEYVKTFYPMSEDWFEKNAELETILKDNPTFTLKELATFHVQAVLNAKR